MKKAWPRGGSAMATTRLHHVLLSQEGTAITDFGRCHFGVQTGDFAHFFRKILEKQNWDKVYGNAMLREYGRVRPLSGRSRRIFGYGFPIRRNSGSWPITSLRQPEKLDSRENVEKLRSLIRQRG